MRTIRIKRTTTRFEKITIYGNPSLGTWGSHQLLLQEYRSLDETWIHDNPNKLLQLQFNTKFLEKVKSKHNELHCEYCGKKDLKIYDWRKASNQSDMATADHFLPKSKHPHLALEESNMVVACRKCNSNKKDYEVSSNHLKYKYV